eukprot:COSAG05_NODE_3288_length_2175_cov_1.331888_2_plen_327_part_00
MRRAPRASRRKPSSPKPMLHVGLSALLLIGSGSSGDAAAAAGWERGMGCAHYVSRDPNSPTRCDGWESESQEHCLQLCINNTLPSGCARPDGFRCEYEAWSDNPDFPPGWCQVANATCAPVSDPNCQLYHLPPVNATCDLAHYEECAAPLQQYGKECSQAGGGAPDEVRRCLDFFFGGPNATEYCCPCIIFYADKYELPALGPACTDAPTPPAPPPTPPWGPCTSMDGQWQNVDPGAAPDDIVRVEQRQGACTWRATDSEQGWNQALAVWVSQWDLLVTFLYDGYNSTFSGHLRGCNPETCPSGSTISYTSSTGDTGRWQKISDAS